MVRRNVSLAFGGMWTFPGGVLEESDGPVPDVADATDRKWGDPALLSTAARGAVRETREETALRCDVASLAWFSHWIPPTVGPPKRFATWFFLAPEHEGEIVVDRTENDDARWVAPAHALEICEAGDYPLAVPTWVTLDDLAAADSLPRLLDSVITQGARIHHTRAFPDERGRILCWSGDAAYDSDDVDTPGPRNRVLATREFTVIERIVV